MLTRLLCGLIRGYQVFISPLLPRSCRFHPTCSEYARQALIEYGVLKGLARAAWRLLRCNPFNPGGYDPVVPCDHASCVTPVPARRTSVVTGLEKPLNHG